MHSKLASGHTVFGDLRSHRGDRCARLALGARGGREDAMVHDRPLKQQGTFERVASKYQFEQKWTMSLQSGLSLVHAQEHAPPPTERLPTKKRSCLPL